MTTESKRLGLTESEHTHKQMVEAQEKPCHDGASSTIDMVTEGKMTDQSRNAAVMDRTLHPQQSIFSRVWHFVLHYIEMCLAMCIGGILLNIAFFMGAAQIGYPDLTVRYPEFSVLMISILLAIPMAVWMRVRGHDWRSNLEMSSSTILLAFLLIGAAWLGVITKSSLIDWMTRLACPVMLIPMLSRLNLYTGSHASHKRHAHAAHGGM